VTDLSLKFVVVVVALCCSQGRSHHLAYAVCVRKES